MTGYIFAQVNGKDWHPVLDPLYRQHFAQMQERLAADGIKIGAYAPRLDQYFAGIDRGDFLTFVALADGAPVGYLNVWRTNDMHTGEPIAQEDALFVLPEHRRGVGKKLVQHVMAHLKAAGVKRLTITPVTDLRVGKIWRRMGYRPVAELMTYTF